MNPPSCHCSTPRFSGTCRPAHPWRGFTMSHHRLPPCLLLWKPGRAPRVVAPSPYHTRPFSQNACGISRALCALRSLCLKKFILPPRVFSVPFAQKPVKINNVETQSCQPLPAPRGVTVQHAARMLHYSAMTIRRMIADGTLVAWKPRGPRGRKWLIDEISLGTLQAALIQAARRKAAPVQSALLQGELPLGW